MNITNTINNTISWDLMREIIQYIPINDLKKLSDAHAIFAREIFKDGHRIIFIGNIHVDLKGHYVSPIWPIIGNDKKIVIRFDSGAIDILIPVIRYKGDIRIRKFISMIRHNVINVKCIKFDTVLGKTEYHTIDYDSKMIMYCTIHHITFVKYTNLPNVLENTGIMIDEACIKDYEAGQIDYIDLHNNLAIHMTGDITVGKFKVIYQNDSFL